MVGFERQMSVVGGDRSTNCATTAVGDFFIYILC